MLLESTVSTGLTQLITDAGAVISAVMTHVGTVASTLISTPLFIVPMGFFILGGAIGIVSRLLRK